MKGNKKLLVIAILLLLITASFATYAIYRSSTTATGTIEAAAWQVKVKKDSDAGDGTAIASANLTFDATDITWTGTHHGKNNTIAPGDTGTIQFVVDATGSEVDVVIEAEIDTTAQGYNIPSGITAAVTSGTNGAVSVAYDANSMTATVTITVTWQVSLSDNSTKDTADLAAQNATLSIPVKLTARQDI